jgi:hypothetical protein
MKLLNLLSVIMLSVLISACNHQLDTGEGDNKANVPQALTDNNSDLLSKRYYHSESLVNSLYTDLTNAHPELKNIEDELKLYRQMNEDSLQLFNSFHSKSANYYSDANDILANINDPVLKERLQVLINNSESSYKQKMASHFAPKKQIENNNASIEGLHQVLKIVATLPVLERYQKDNQPGVKAMANTVQAGNKLKGKLGAVANKYEAKLK